MKKILLVLGLVFATMTASAQWYAGGALGFELDGAWKDKDGNKNGDSFSQFGILPEVGYAVSDKFDVGIALEFTLGTHTEWANDKKTESLKTTMFGVSPYVRYTFCEFGKFSLLGKAAFNLGFGTGKPSSFDADGKETEGLKSGATVLGFAITPVVLYSLSDKICLYTNLNFAGLNFESVTTKYDGDKTGSQSYFGIGANTDNAFTLGAIQVGFVFTF